MRLNIHIKILIYGYFAVLCHTVGILLFFLSNRTYMPSQPLVRLCSAMLEHSLMSLVILSMGSLLIYYVLKKEG